MDKTLAANCDSCERRFECYTQAFDFVSCQIVQSKTHTVKICNKKLSDELEKAGVEFARYCFGHVSGGFMQGFRHEYQRLLGVRDELTGKTSNRD